MLSVDTQGQLVNWITTLAKEERAIETIRQVLGEQALFAPYTAFLRIDREGRGFLDKNDIKALLKYIYSQ